MPRVVSCSEHACRRHCKTARQAHEGFGSARRRPHDLRHEFVARKLADGVPAQLVMRYVGHANLATTFHYTHLLPEQLRAVVGAGMVEYDSVANAR
jgi:integrase